MTLYWNDLYNPGTGLYGTSNDFSSGDLHISNLYVSDSVNANDGLLINLGQATDTTRIGKINGNTIIQGPLAITGNTTITQFSNGLLQSDNNGRISSSFNINGNLNFTNNNPTNSFSINFGNAGSLTGVNYPFPGTSYILLNTPYGFVANGQNDLYYTSFEINNYADLVLNCNLRIDTIQALNKPLLINNTNRVISGNINIGDVNNLPQTLANIQTISNTLYVAKSGDIMTGTLEMLNTSINVKKNNNPPSFGGYIQLTPNVSGRNKIYTDGEIPTDIDGQLSQNVLNMTGYTAVQSQQPFLCNDIRSLGTSLNIGSTSATSTLNVGVGSQLQTINIGTGALLENDTINIGSDTSTINIYGNTHYVQITNYAVSDKDIQLNANAVGSGTARDAGIVIRDNNINNQSYLITDSLGTGWLMKAPETNQVLNFKNSNFNSNGFIKSTPAGIPGLNAWTIQPATIGKPDLPSTVAYTDALNVFVGQQTIRNGSGTRYQILTDAGIDTYNTDLTHYTINGDPLQNNEFIIQNYTKANIKCNLDLGDNSINSTYLNNNFVSNAYVNSTFAPNSYVNSQLATKANLNGATFTNQIAIQYGGKYQLLTNNILYTDASLPYTIDGQNTSGNIVIKRYDNMIVEQPLTVQGNIKIPPSVAYAGLETATIRGAIGLNTFERPWEFMDDLTLQGNLRFIGQDYILGDITNNINLFSNVSMGANIISSSAVPTSSTTLVNKQYADTKVSKSGDTMTGTLNMGSNKITSTYTPLNSDDLTNVLYVNTHVASEIGLALSDLTSQNTIIYGDWSFNNTKTTFSGQIISNEDNGAILIRRQTASNPQYITWQNSNGSAAYAVIEVNGSGGQSDAFSNGGAYDLNIGSYTSGGNINFFYQSTNKKAVIDTNGLTVLNRLYQRNSNYQIAFIEGASSPTLPDSGTYPNGLSFGNDSGYAWVQSWNSRPLIFNRLGNNVEFGNAGAGISVNVYGGALNVYNNANTGRYYQLGHTTSYVGASNYTISGQNQGYYYAIVDFGNYYVGASWQVVSDRRYKNSIKQIETQEAIEVIEALNPVEFKYNGNDIDTYSGFIAQEVERVNPDFVKGTDDRKALDYNSIFVYQTKVIQYLLEENKLMNERLKKIETYLNL